MFAAEGFQAILLVDRIKELIQMYKYVHTLGGKRFKVAIDGLSKEKFCAIERRPQPWPRLPFPCRVSSFSLFAIS
jgi:hypothetical protein